MSIAQTTAAASQWFSTSHKVYSIDSNEGRNWFVSEFVNGWVLTFANMMNRERERIDLWLDQV